MHRWSIATLAAFVVILGYSGKASAEIELTVGRFFDPCIEASGGVERASGEACILQAMFDAFSAEDNGVTVDLLPAHRDRYYTQLETSYAADAPPDVHILHRHRLHEFASKGWLAVIGGDLPAAGIDFSDWAPAALDAVTIDNKIFGIPFDVHANLWHVNLALLGEAGLIGKDGRPVLPASPGELMEQAKQVKEATGKAYLAADFAQYPIGVRTVLSLLWQQGRNVVDGKDVTIDTPEMRAAITTITDLFDEGLADPTHDYETAQQAFLNGEVAILINGTWAVDLYDREASKLEVALTDYDIADFPALFDRPATWADSHVWVVPASLKADRPEVYLAALAFLSWIDQHNLDWARTGHLAVRSSVLESDAYATFAHRLDYLDSIDAAHDIPPTDRYDAIQDILTEALQAIWRDGRPIDEALAAAEADVQAMLD